MLIHHTCIMEKLIIIYSALIIFLLVAILVLLLWQEENLTGERINFRENLLATCVSMIGGLILHLNWLILPWAREQKGDLLAFMNFGIVAVTFSLLIVCFLKSTPNQF